jgi:small subunit ribosomal protein S1
MSKKDLFGDEVIRTDSEDFASMFETSQKGAGRKLRPGDAFKGEILSISKESVFVSTGTPTDGALPTREILDENSEPKFKTGDVIDVIVVRLKHDEILLRYKGAGSSSSDVDNLEDAFDMELPIEGKVLEAVKGGFKVQIQSQKAFCPVSQIDLKFVTDTAAYIGNKYSFVITQYDPRNLVVSRRKVLEIEKAENEGVFLTKHKVGDILEGTVKRLERFGAFVELEGGVEGLVHISELAWSRISDPTEVVSLEQKVSVKIIKAEEENSRLKISLSIKQGGGEDPWLTLIQKYPVGSLAEGVVDKKESFGFFVKIGPGITGLLPKSKLKDHPDAKDYENKKKGDPIKVQIDQIMFEEKRVSLRIPSEIADESWRGHQVSQKNFGTMAELFKGLKK